MKTEQRETINKTLDDEKEEIRTARVGWDGKQHIVRFPQIISQMANISQDDKIKFIVNIDSKETRLTLIKGDKK